MDLSHHPTPVRPTQATHPPICVLSVGRSGTSLAARTLDALGVHLGAPDDLMPPSEQHRLGFFEHLGIHEINEAILQVFGGSWSRPPALDPGWEQDPRLDPQRRRARALVAELAVHGRWAFKDPRTAVTLPFWRSVVGRMDYLVCVRSPEASVRPVAATGLPGGTPAASTALWLQMNAAILRQTAAARRHFVFFEDWFADPDRVYAGIAAFVGAPAPAPGAAAAVFDPAQRRADHPPGVSAARSDARRTDAMLALLRLAQQVDQLEDLATTTTVRRSEARVAAGLCDEPRVGIPTPDTGLRPATVWLTGLPAAGKTTLARALRTALAAEGASAVILDGDELRHGVSADLGFSAADREEQVRRVDAFAQVVLGNGVVPIVALVSPCRAAREAVRERHRAAGLGFVEVWVDAPVSVCAARDPKGLYAQARAGRLHGLTGVDEPYEPPADPEVRTAGRDVDAVVRDVLAHLRRP